MRYILTCTRAPSSTHNALDPRDTDEPTRDTGAGESPTRARAAPPPARARARLPSASSLASSHARRSSAPEPLKKTLGRVSG